MLAISAAAQQSRKPALRIGGFQAPESVIYDSQADIYLVSNINGSPVDRDDNGFITRLAPSGAVKARKWIDGARPEVELHAPKGMAIVGDTLYVADLDTVRTFDRRSGAPKEQIAIPGAVFLNSIAAGPDAVYVSDTGVDRDFKPVDGGGAIYEIRGGAVKQIARGVELRGPNGLAAQGEDLWAVSFLGNALYNVTADGRIAEITTLPKGQLDGFVILPGGNFLITSWEAQGVYAGRPGAEFTLRLSDLPSPAGIGFDTKRHRLLVPSLQKDKVAVFDWSPQRTRMGRSGSPPR